MFRNLMQSLGAWTTVIKWHEPWMYRVRLKEDWLPRFAVAFAVGGVVTTLLLFLFAVNVKPPSPVFALTGMAIFGGLTLMFLVNGHSTAGGRVRLCEEGIIRRRMYAGMSSQWIEEWNWPYSEIPQCAIIPGAAIGKSFGILMLTDGAEIELIAIPERVNLEEVAQLLTARGVVVRRDVRQLPPQFLQPMGLPIPLVASAISLCMLIGGLGFYVMKTAGRRGNEVAARKREPVRNVDPGRLPGVEAPPIQPNPNEVVPGAAPPVSSPPSSVPPAARPGFTRPEFPNAPSMRPVLPSIPPNNPAPNPTIPPTSNPTAPSTTNPTIPPTSNPTTPPSVASEPDAVTAFKRRNPALAELENAAKTELIGGTGGSEFGSLSPKREPVVGFRCRLGNWGGKSAVAKLDPLNQRDAPARSDQMVVAREGYVVGGIQVDADELVQAVRIVFVKRADDGQLDKSDFYFSDWIGQPTGRPTKTLGKGNVPVIGVYGRRGLVIDAVGLVLAE